MRVSFGTAANGEAVINIGWVIALLVLVATFILWLLGKLDPQYAALFGALALARML